MTLERRSCTGSAPHVTKRLCATLMFFIGVVCVFGGKNCVCVFTNILIFVPIYENLCC